MKVFYTFLIILISASCFGQNNFDDDLNSIYTNLKKSSSYKTQKQNWKKVDSVYSLLKKVNQKDLTTIDQYIKLYNLVDQIKDYHCDIYGNIKNFSYSDLQNPEFLDKIKSSPKYNFYPKRRMNLDSLENKLKERKLKDYEGIYSYQKLFKIGVIKRTDELLEGIILETQIPSWQKGETILF